MYNLPHCTGDGAHPVPNIKNRFYTCSRDGRKYDQFIFECPKGKEYDPVLKKCARKPVKKVHKVSFYSII